ncbi:lytic transglycosylase domain-containing protein [Lachnospiraceae bacterium NSJ-143]|nr:lytic transglycosylase domain-containing protein [Lachnospiraceae bacterium NSJ-143]
MGKNKSRTGFIKWFAVIVFLAVIAAGVFKHVVLKKILYPQSYKNYVEKYAAEYNVDANLVYAVIKCESDFDCRAVSHKDARGLMQISEVTGIWASEVLEIENYSSEILYEPETNVHIGCWYLSRLFKQFESEPTVLAAYNAGSGNVSGWLTEEEYSSDGINLDTIPFKETANYVKKVEKAKRIYEYLYD